MISALRGDGLPVDVEVLLVDVRYPYEHDGGHINKSINISSLQQLESLFFTSLPTSSRKVVVFHCEYSIQRAPQMALHLRKTDRNLNAISYPKLHYPDLYILKGGYAEFFAKQKVYINCDQDPL